MKHLTALIFILLSANIVAASQSREPYSGWLVTNTPHFKIIYEKKSTESVNEIVGFSEDVYNSVTSFFDSYPEKIVLVVHDRIDIANGSFYPAPQHINLYVTAPSEPEFGAKVDNWLKFLLTHELTHYVNMTIKKGLFYQLSKFMGKSISSIPGGLMPGWAVEGIAVKLESDLTVGGRGNNPFFEMYSKALVMENKLFSWRQAAYTSLHPPFGRIYIAGYLINDYMARKYGNDIFVKIYKDFLNFPLLGFNYYVKKITGDSTKKIFLRMESELIQKYSTTSTTPGKLLSPDIESDYFLPKITNSGWIVYRETKDKGPAIVLLDPISKIEKILVKTRLTDHSSYSATEDSKFVVFTALNVDDIHPTGLTAVSDLYLYNKQTNKVNQITHNAHLRQPAISPDGKKIVAVQKTGQYTRLVDINIETGKINILFNQENAYVFNPVFSKDGKQLAFTVQNTKGRELYFFNSKNTLKTFNNVITGDVYNPTYIKNGNIIFVSDRERTLSLYEIEMAKEIKLTKIFTDPVGIYEGTISNNEIIYSTYSSNGFTLKTAPYIGNEIVKNRNNNCITPSILSNPDKTTTSSLLLKNNTIKNYSKYVDLPKLVAYTPIPFYINPIYESTQIFGPGVTSYFRSILGKSEIFTTISMDMELLQPGSSLDFSYNWGPVGLNYNLLQGYSASRNTYKALQTTWQELIIDIPVTSHHNLGKSTYFGFYTGLIDNYTITSNKDFPFFSPLMDSETDYNNNIFQLNGIAFSYTGQKSRGDTINPLIISSSTFLYTPISHDFLKQYAFKSTNSISFPSLPDHQVFKLSGRFTDSEIENLPFLNNPRGFYVLSDSNIKLLTAAEYLFTIAVPDLPILSGLSLQGITGAIHIEKMFTIQDSSLLIDENFYGGLEIILLGNYITAFESAGFGINYRFKPNSSTFSTEDLGINLFIGTNSFK